MTVRDAKSRGTARRYAALSAAAFAGLLILVVLNLTSMIGRMEQRDALMAEFLACVDRQGGTYEDTTEWIWAGGRPLAVPGTATEVSPDDAAIHDTCWSQVTFEGP